MTKHEAQLEAVASVENPLDDLLSKRKAETEARERRSAAAKLGWITRRAAEALTSFYARDCDCSPTSRFGR